ncbi:MAG: DNA/RNA non-specific endonuclease [Muribaculaceae bacterium]|nr:DNA/RNA non-specific endonuclease [Muribaculaceae bacterium]
MKQLVKIWIIVVAMVAGGALPPQVTGDSTFSTQWSVQAKSKHKNKEKHKKSKKKSGRAKQTAKQFQSGKRSTASTLTSVPVIGKAKQQAVAPQSVNSLLGVGIPKGVSNQVINYKAIRVNFNPSLRIPNCVAYELTATMVDMTDAPGHEVRKNYNYNKDPNIKSCPDHWEYRGSGYSRGHMAPAMDMRWDKTTMTQCFYMTNMCPQDTKLNNDDWRVLEERVHRWAKRDKRIMVYTGPIMGKNPKKIGKDKQSIAVPDAFFKVLYAPDQGRSIAFIYDNRPCPGSISKYAVTVAEVERRTGLTFSSAIPKRQCDITAWE